MELLRYLKNVAVAVSGRNPYVVELDDIKSQLKEVVTTSKELSELSVKISEEKEAAERRLYDLQELTETLRQHLSDKDLELDLANGDVRRLNTRLDEQRKRYENAVNTMRKQHATQREDMETEMAQLREDRDYALNCLQQAKQEQAHECMANIMLERTNNWFDDFYAALVSGDPDEVALVGERDNLGSRQAKIAQQCVVILRRKKELERKIEAK